jgi:hypothetical protein
VKSRFAAIGVCLDVGARRARTGVRDERFLLATVRLPGWHRVLLSSERGAPVMGHVVFID